MTGTRTKILSRSIFLKLVGAVVCIAILAACSQGLAETPLTPQQSIIAPPSETTPATITPATTSTETPQPTSTPTETPEPTPTPTSEPTATPDEIVRAGNIARKLGYGSYTDCRIKQLPGVNTDNLLVSIKDGVLGYYNPKTDTWKSTKGWKEVLSTAKLYLEGNFKYIIQQNVSKTYSILGVTDGVAVEEPFKITKASGELLATNLLAYRMFYLDSQKKLQSVTVPLLVKLPDGTHFTPDASGYASLEGKYGEQFTLEEARQFLKGKFENQPGKMFSTLFFISPQSVDESNNIAKAAGHPLQPGSYYARQLQFIRDYVTGRESEMKNLVQTGDSSLGLVLSSGQGSLFYGPSPKIIDLPNN